MLTTKNLVSTNKSSSKMMESSRQIVNTPEKKQMPEEDVGRVEAEEEEGECGEGAVDEEEAREFVEEEGGGAEVEGVEEAAGEQEEAAGEEQVAGGQVDGDGEEGQEGGAVLEGVAVLGDVREVEGVPAVEAGQRELGEAFQAGRLVRGSWRVEGVA